MNDQLFDREKKIENYATSQPQTYDENQTFGNVQMDQKGEEIISRYEDGIDRYAHKINDDKIGDNEYMRENHPDYYLNQSRNLAMVRQEQYYFRNSERSDAKAARYQNLSQNADALKEHAKTHGNRSASKRAKKSRDASKAYQKVARLQRAYENDLEKRQPQEESQSRTNGRVEWNVQNLRDFARLDEITRARIAALTYAAQAKSISKEQEEYSIQKGKLQNLLVLRDALERLARNTSSDRSERDRIQVRQNALDKEIETTRDKVTRLASQAG